MSFTILRFLNYVCSKFCLQTMCFFFLRPFFLNTLSNAVSFNQLSLSLFCLNSTQIKVIRFFTLYTIFQIRAGPVLPNILPLTKTIHHLTTTSEKSLPAHYLFPKLMPHISDFSIVNNLLWVWFCICPFSFLPDCLSY